MELTLKPHTDTIAPLRAILLRGASVGQWLSDLQLLQLPIDKFTAYTIPGESGTSIWGCVVVLNGEIKVRVPGHHAYCQCLHGLLFFPEQATVTPHLSQKELDYLLVSRPHFFHPETGLIELVKPVDWNELIQLPALSPSRSTMPARPAFIPERVKTFQIQPVAIDEVLSQLDHKLSVERQELKNEPLTTSEKIKLWLLQRLLGKPDNRHSDTLARNLKKWLPVKSRDIDQTVDKLNLDLQALEERNKKQLDRLLEMCRNNPEDALKYAIPLDPEHTARGKQLTELTLSPQWSKLGPAVWGGLSAVGGSILLPDNSYYTLQQQYQQMAQELIRKGDYQKAAFVYLKLLKDYYSTAKTLEDGKLYQEAASIWLKHLNNKEKAADCYEKASMYQSAIDLYLSLNNHNKLGDLYSKLNRFADARRHYKEVINELIRQQQYLKAADVYANKMREPSQAQATRLEGWKKQADAFNCLIHFISNIPGAKQKYEAMRTIYYEDVNERSFRDYLHVLRSVYGQDQTYQDAYTEIAHEIIVNFQAQHSELISELRFFDSRNSLLLKDILRYKNNIRHTR